MVHLMAKVSRFEGPPKDANQTLPEFTLKVEKKLLFIALQETSIV